MVCCQDCILQDAFFDSSHEARVAARSTNHMPGAQKPRHGLSAYHGLSSFLQINGAFYTKHKCKLLSSDDRQQLCDDRVMPCCMRPMLRYYYAAQFCVDQTGKNHITGNSVGFALPHCVNLQDPASRFVKTFWRLLHVKAWLTWACGPRLPAGSSTRRTAAWQCHIFKASLECEGQVVVRSRMDALPTPSQKARS